MNKQPVEEWEEKLRVVFAEYVAHERLDREPFVVWLNKFIKSLLSSDRERVRAEAGKIVEMCENCENDDHFNCTGCRCHADY